jgi:hypothetical protein
LFEKEKFCSVLRADQTGRDDLGVVEDKQVFRGKKRGKIPDAQVLQVAIFPAQKKKTGGIPRMGGSRGNLPGGDGVGEKLFEGIHCGLTDNAE